MGKLVWTQHPNGGRMAGVATSREDWEKVCARGWLKIRGQRAVPLEEFYDDRPGHIRFKILFDEPYPWPHP